MKKLLFILLTIFLYVSVAAQSITLRFEGANNTTNTNVRNYEVVVDGRNYYSLNAEISGTTGARQLVINDLDFGSHQLEIYRINDNSTVSRTEKGAPVYSNTFQLRAGYDMIIAIRRNGQVTFSEKKNTPNPISGAASKTAMSDNEFDKLVKSVTAKWSQTSRATAIKTAFTNKAYFFNTDQVGQLLLLLTSETKRLELAKLSYPKVTDPGNFGDVADLFTTQANKDNMEKFIQSKNPVSTTTSDVYNSRPPLTTQQFNQLLQTAKNQYQQSGKYAVVQDAFNVNSNYFTTSQLRQLLTLITDQSERLSLAKLSYARVSDVSNFTSLYNMFTTQASRDELNNFIRYGETTAAAGEYSNRTAMNDSDFSKLELKARLHIRQSSTVADVKEALSNKTYYFSLEQIRALLSLVGTESDRLALAKLAYHRASDPTTFSQLFDLFSTQATIDNLNNYIKTNRS